MKESTIHTKIRKNFVGVIHKNHGSAYGTAGLPDLEGCFKSKFVGPGDASGPSGGISGRSIVIEVKVGHIGRNDRVVLNSPLTEIQGYWLDQYHARGALALLAVYLVNCKKIIFFPSPWNLQTENAIRCIPFMEKEFVEKSVWTG